jgi:hypothetical protein
MSLLYCVSSVFCFCICFILLLHSPVFLTQTVPIEEFTPPSQINIHTFVEQSTQTLPHPTTCNTETQTQPEDEQAVIQKWKKEYVAT